MMPISSPRPLLSEASASLTHDVEVIDERGRRSIIAIPAERPLTVYVDKRELVTLMTLGGAPEALTLGYLRNQRLVKSVAEIESVQVDWSVDAVAVVTRNGIADVEQRTSKKVVTTGCGQGSVFGGLMDEIDQISLPPDARLRQSVVYRIVDTIQMGIPFLLSRSGTTQMGHMVAERVGMSLLARCSGKHFLLLTGQDRLEFEPQLLEPVQRQA
jgi:FdhD protein